MHLIKSRLIVRDDPLCAAEPPRIVFARLQGAAPRLSNEIRGLRGNGDGDGGEGTLDDGGEGHNIAFLVDFIASVFRKVESREHVGCYDFQWVVKSNLRDVCEEIEFCVAEAARRVFSAARLAADRASAAGSTHSKTEACAEDALDEAAKQEASTLTSEVRGKAGRALRRNLLAELVDRARDMQFAAAASCSGCAVYSCLRCQSQRF